MSPAPAAASDCAEPTRSEWSGHAPADAVDRLRAAVDDRADAGGAEGGVGCAVAPAARGAQGAEQGAGAVVEPGRLDPALHGGAGGGARGSAARRAALYVRAAWAQHGPVARRRYGAGQ